MATTPLESPTTFTGVRRFVAVPSPSWPDPLNPQHLTPPPLVSAQVWYLPAAMAMTPLESPNTNSVC